MPIVVTGIEEVKRRLDRLSSPKTKLAIERAGCRAAAKVLLAAQQATVPYETGKLEGSLGIQVAHKYSLWQGCPEFAESGYCAKHQAGFYKKLNGAGLLLGVG